MNTPKIGAANQIRLHTYLHKINAKMAVMSEDLLNLLNLNESTANVASLLGYSNV